MSVRPATVLVVDDNQLNLELVTLVLEAAGHVVRLARSGPDALEAIRREAPELILLDIGLPGMDGYAVLRALKDDRATARIPVVALTAYAMAEDEQRALQSGFDGYITKPFDVRTLAQTLARILDGMDP
ncbi:MAG TPA: response regulator, partial [Thermoanaerobaculia bacterium]|nr:response regulator [Thermoanaerobaculia bacterium]